MRVVGCQGRRIFSRLAACCKASELVDSSFDLPPPRGRMEAGHPGVDTVMPLSPSGFSHEQLRNGGRFRPHGRQPGTAQNACMSPLFRRKTKEASPTSPVCHLLNVPEFKPKSHFLQDMQQNRLKVSVNKQMHKQKGARATGNNSRGQVSDHQTGRQISDGKSADLLFKKQRKSADLINASRHHAFMHSGMYDEQKRWVPVPYAPLVRSSINDAGVTANY